MLENQVMRPASVVGPLGERLTIDRLPPPVTRWVARRKAEVVAAVNGGLISTGDACTLYEISEQELTSWQVALNRSGMKGLRVTRLKEYRETTLAAAKAETGSA